MEQIRNIKNKQFIYSLSTALMVIVGYAIMQSVINANLASPLIKGLMVPLCIYSILAISLNLVVGISGELSLGHAGFMCIGAFASCIFTRYMKWLGNESLLIFIIAILIGAVAAGLAGFLIGIPVLRLRGDYLAIVTLAFGEIIKNVINAIYLGVDSTGFKFSMKDSLDLNLGEGGVVIIKGAQGITNAPRYSTFLIGAIILLICVVILNNFINSYYGRNIMAIRDNRIAAESIGLNAGRYKLLAFTIGSAMAGVAGVLYAHNLNTLAALPKNFGYNMSITILVFVVLGGMGNIRGSIISAVILTVLPEFLREFSNYRMLVYSILLVTLMIFSNAPALKDFRENLLSKFNFGKNKKLVNKE